jgi:hypothetical protein
MAGGGNLYDADEEVEYNKIQLAMFAYIFDFDPTDVDSMSMEDAVTKLRAMWKYTNDTKSSVEPAYTDNAIPRFFSMVNASLTSRLRKAKWNHALAGAAKNEL